MESRRSRTTCLMAFRAFLDIVYYLLFLMSNKTLVNGYILSSVQVSKFE